MKKEWKYHPEGCDNCGSDIEIFTQVSCEEGSGYDGDPIRCKECGEEGYWSVASEEEAYVNWPNI